MRTLMIFVLFLLLPGIGAMARDASSPTEPGGVPGVSEAQLSADFWIARARDAESVLMDSPSIAARNVRLLKQDRSMHDVAALPTTLDGNTVRGWIEALSVRPQHTRYDEDGKPIADATLDDLMDALALDAIPATQATRYGLIVHRAALRSFPTTLRVFSEPGDTDIDRFQESGIFPGTPVVIAHTSRDGKWVFVVSSRYAAWLRADVVAEGARDIVLGYPARTPYRVITGDDVHTVYTPEQPALSQLELDMGTRVPLATGLAADQPVNGQSTQSAWTLELPLRGSDGKLVFAPALLRKTADSTADYLPLTRANILRQAFKFLGERYGWGHDYDGRDCSGFVSDVYQSMGILMPRNTRDQSVSPTFEHQRFDQNSSRDSRIKAIAGLDIGDLIYIPGHVMMVIGEIDGVYYVIHDTGGMSHARSDGTLARIKLNAVSVTPLEPLMFDDNNSYIDRMTSIVHVQRKARP